jgi:hypothetical protein
MEKGLLVKVEIHLTVLSRIETISVRLPAASLLRPVPAWAKSLSPGPRGQAHQRKEAAVYPRPLQYGRILAVFEQPLIIA